MKSLKKVPPGAKGLRKLPTAVRNKMGYMQKGGKVTKKMVDEEFTSNMNSSMNLTNELAKRASTGLKKNGFPMKPAAAKALKKEVARRKKQEQKAKPNYRYVGTKLPDGPAPFEDDGMPKAKNGMKAVKKYKKGGKVKKGSKKSTTPPKEIDLGPTIASKYRLSLKDAEEMTDRVQKNYGKHPSEIKTGYKGIDSRLSEIESNERQARARAGNKYYDGDGAGAARSEKAYADRLGRRVLAKMSAEKMKYKKGGKIVKYQGGGKSVMLDDVVVKGKKGAGVREQGVVARGKTGAEFTKHRNELIDQFTADYIRKMKRHPDYKLNSREMSDVMDKVRTQMYKDGYQETGVIRKDTKERLSPAMEKAAKDRLRRK